MLRRIFEFLTQGCEEYGRPTSEHQKVVVHNKEVVEHMTNAAFGVSSLDRVIDEQIEQRQLRIDSLSFALDKKWVFLHGNKRFRAWMRDPLFLERIHRGVENFAKGDVLEVIVRERRFLHRGQVQTEYVVEKVIQHIRFTPQYIPLFSDDEDSGQ